MGIDNRKYDASGAGIVMQGDNQNNIVTGNMVTIGGSLKEQQKRVEGLEELRALLKESDLVDKDKAVRYLVNAKEELTEEAEPDNGSIEKYMNKARNILKLAEKGSKLFELAKTVLTSFGIILD